MAEMAFWPRRASFARVFHRMKISCSRESGGNWLTRRSFQQDFSGTDNPYQYDPGPAGCAGGLASGETGFNSLDDVTADLGDQVGGRLLLQTRPRPARSQPIPGLPGVFMSAVGEIFGGTSYGFGTVIAGVLQVGMALAGKILAAAGKVIIDVSGITLTAQVYPAAAFIPWLADDNSAQVGRINLDYGGAAVIQGCALPHCA